MSPIDMVLVNESHIDEAYLIIVERTRWLNEKGIPQWRTPYPKENFLNDINQGSVYSFMQNGEVLGTVTLYKNRPRYYPKNVFNDAVEARYLCRLAVSRDGKYRGMGKHCLTAIDRMAIENRVSVLRLDVTKQNAFLEKYYLGQSYKKITEGNIFTEHTVFMEKRLTISK